MKHALIVAAVCLGWSLAAMGGEAAKDSVHPDSSGWANLFNEDLSDATFNKGVWFIENGELTASRDECIWTREQYENFILDLEFRNGEAANSGVIIYTTDLRNWIPNSVEIQIADDHAPQWASAARTWQCAAIFGRQAATKQMVRKAGEWNRMTITCRGPMITVALNGEVVNECDMRKFTSAKKNPDGSDVPPWLSRPMAELATRGHIGLQGKHGGAAIYFRNVKIKQAD
jgi:hypothetical protein